MLMMLYKQESSIAKLLLLAFIERLLFLIIFQSITFVPRETKVTCTR